MFGIKKKQHTQQNPTENALISLKNFVKVKF